MSTVESIINMIILLTYPIWLIYFVTINRSRITNTLIAPIRVCITTSSIYKYFPKPKIKSNRRQCYHHKRHCRHRRNCASRRSRTGCRFQRPTSNPHGGGGCRRPKHQFKWKTTGSTEPKSKRCYRHDKTSSVFSTPCSTSSPTYTLDIFLQACSINRELFFFDALDDMDDIILKDTIANIDVFHSCFDYSKDNIFLNRYQETCTETYHDTLSYTYPTNLADSTNQTSLTDSISRNVDTFLQSIDILKQSRIWSSILPSVNIPLTYKLLPSSDLRYKVILLKAHCLQLNLSNYDERVLMPLQNPAVYHSNKPDELPIVIDTGASCSITPVHSDFTSTIQPSNVPVLNNISGTTAVVGQGTIEWNIQDANGIVKLIQTSAYYVPQATIRLFSPQVYINEDKSNTSEMILKKNGVHLVLSCGARLFFPINCGSNLPVMLTETALNKGNKKGTFTIFHLQDKLNFQPSADQINLQLLANQLSIFQATILDKSLLSRDNINLSPSSKELLLWHCRLGHADFQRILSILAKPESARGSEEKGELVRRMIHPSTKVSNALIPKCIAWKETYQDLITDRR
jgi:hypothetical protein